MALEVQIDLNKPKWADKLLALILAIALTATFLIQIPELWDRYRVVKDVQNLYLMARFQDPALFVNDPQGGFGAIDLVVFGRPITVYPRSLGYGILFLLGSFFIDYLWLIKGLTFILMPLTVVYLFKLGQHLKDNLTGLCLSLFFVFFILASYQSISISSGLQRAFAVPLTIIFMYYLVKQQYLATGLTLIANALIYLPNFPVLALTYIFVLFNVDFPLKRIQLPDKSTMLSLVISFSLSALIIGFALAIEFNLVNLSLQNEPLIGDQTSHILTSQQLLDHSQDYAELYFGFPFLGRAGVLDSGTDAINVMVLLIFSLLIYTVVGRQSVRRLPDAFRRLFIASVIMYVLSMIAIFGLSSLALYFPSRYTRVTLFILPLFFVGLNWPLFLEKLPVWWRRNIRLALFFIVSFGMSLALVYFLLPAYLPLLPLLWLFGLILSGIFTVLGGSYVIRLIGGYTSLTGLSRIAMAVGMAGITLFLGINYIKILGLRPINPSEPARDIYEYIATLPKDALIAGEPELMVGVPLFSRRPVLFNALHPDINAPILDYFDMQYAEAPEKVLNFCQHYSVDYLVLDITNFAPEFLASKQFFFQPYNDIIIDIVATRSSFVLPHFPTIYTSHPFIVIRCDAETIIAGNQD